VSIIGYIFILYGSKFKKIIFNWLIFSDFRNIIKSCWLIEVI
jgi:hypothetical protein